MLSQVTKKRLLIPTLLSLAALALWSSCKPVDTGSRTLETGGTLVDWRIRSTVTSTGGLTLEKSGNGSTDEAAQIIGAAVEISSAPNGTITMSSITAKQWLPLRAGNSADDVKFNLLMTTRNLGLCYSNAIQLNGTTDIVTCKDAGTSSATSSQNEAKRAEMQRVCDRLSRTQIPDALSTSEVYTRYDATLSREKCTCLRGKERDLFYGNFYTRTAPATEFETDCKRLIDPTDTSTGTSTATTLAELQRLAGANGSSGSSGSSGASGSSGSSGITGKTGSSGTNSINNSNSSGGAPTGAGPTGVTIEPADSGK